MTGDPGLALELRAVNVGVPGVGIEQVGLSFGEIISYDEWRLVGLQVALLRDWSAWAIGDWIFAGEALFGEDVVAQGAEVLRRSPDTLIEFRRLAVKFPHQRRRPSLTWSHHQAVAGRDPEEADKWLDLAEQHDWNVMELRGALRAELPRRLDSAALIAAARDVVRAATCRGAIECSVPMQLLYRLRDALGESDE